MSYDTPDVYYQPEHFGLRPIGEISWDNESYQFDMTVVWFHEATQTFFIGSDSGCSCPSPFENTTSLAELSAFPNPHAVMTEIDQMVAGAEQGYSWVENKATIEKDVFQIKDALRKIPCPLGGWPREVGPTPQPVDVQEAIDSIARTIRNRA